MKFVIGGTMIEIVRFDACTAKIDCLCFKIKIINIFYFEVSNRTSFRTIILTLVF